MGLSGEGLTAAQGAGGLLSNLGGDTASLMGAQGAAAAAGTIGAANAWSGAMSGIGNSFTQGMQLGHLNGSGSGPPSPFHPHICIHTRSPPAPPIPTPPP